MPLRSKSGQSTITVLVGKDPAVAAEGRRRAREVAAYYAAAATAIPGLPAVAATATSGASGATSPAATSARDYFSAGAAAAVGGRFCLSGRDAGPGVPAWTAEALEQLGVLPSQPWSAERLEALILGAGRRGHGRGIDRDGVSRPAVRTHAWTFDLPKSFSLLAAYGHDEWLLATLERATRTALEVLVSSATLVRRTENGHVVRDRAAALHCSVILERTARAAVVDRVPGVEVTGVPGLHYHAHILFHLAIDDRGRLGAVDMDDALQHGWRRLASAVADAVVVQEARRHGIPLRLRAPARPGASWSVEVATIPEAAIAVASERHRAIAGARAGTAAGPTGDLAAERLTKARKETACDMSWLAHHWRTAIERAGACDPLASGPDAGVGSRVNAEVVDAAVADALQATFATRSVARWQEVLADLILRCAPVLPDAALWQIATALPQVLANAGELVALTDGRLTTRAILDQEQRILGVWRALAEHTVPDLRPHLAGALVAHQAASGVQLDEEQARLVASVLCRQATLGIGVAGAGKTAAVAALQQAMARTGHRVHVVALAALRARESRLATSAAGDSSIESLLARVGAGTLDRHVAPGDVLVVDEASQLGDDALERILDACARHQVRLLLLGDPRQQTALERGAMVGELARRGAREQWPECVELTIAHRFHDPAMAAALSAFRAGDAQPLADYLGTHGGIVETASDDDGLARIRDAWLRDRTALVVTTGSNLRRDQIGSAIVAALLARGEVATEWVEVQAGVDDPRRVRLHVGQRVRIQRQVIAEDLRTRLAANGETALLERVVPGRGRATPEVQLRFDDGRVLQLRSDALVATHAYVLQSLKAQGATADRVLLDWQDGLDVQRAYPALSRQRESLTVYMAPQTEAFDDGPPPTPAQRLGVAARRDGGLHAAIAQDAAGDPPPQLAALAGAPMLTTTVGEPQETVDGGRVTAAVRGELDAATLSAAELTAALQRLATDSLVGQRRREAVLLRGQVLPLPRSLTTPAPRVTLSPHRAQGPSPRREPLAPRWEPSPAQRPRLEEALATWPAEEQLETRVLLAALSREHRLTPQRAGEMVDTFHSSLDLRWRRHAFAFAVTGAMRPSTGPDAQHACSIVLGQVDPTLAVPTAKPALHLAGHVQAGFPAYHDYAALLPVAPSRGIHL